MADNCTVTDVDSDGKHIGAEVSWAEFEGGNQALNVVSTSSKFNSEGSFLYLMYNNRSELPKLLNQVHSHHSIQPGAAGPNPSKEDVDFNADLLDYFDKNKKPIQPNFFLYYKGTYADYSEKVYIQWKSLLK